jgi:hypothetical protein
MIAELFDPAVMGEMRGPSLLNPMREELQREISVAVKLCDEVPEKYLDKERALEAFRALAEEGDAEWARDEIRYCFEMTPGFGKWFDRLLDSVNTIGWAYWRLRRAELRAYGKEPAR